MINLVLFGPPGSGKGTQAVKLAKKYNLIHLSTGDLFRYNIKNQTQLGTLAKSYMDAGNLVPDEVTSSMVEDFLQKNKNAEGFIFDGYPRTTSQADDLDTMLSEIFNTQIDVTLALDVPDSVLKQRLLERGKTSGRSDDANLEVIQERIQIYYTKTDPVAQFYKNQNKWLEINGVGDIDTITQNLTSEIDKLKVQN